MRVLDYGYVELVETWGSDERVVEAARMSTNKGFLGWGPVHEATCDSQHLTSSSLSNDFYGPCSCTPKAGDEKLLKYLYEHQHSTPFEMAGMVIEVQAPIFVFREWHRHRTQSYNELSARYTPLPNVNYVPTVERLMTSSKTNKQAGVVKGSDELTTDTALSYMHELQRSYGEAQKLYEWALHSGVPKELARIHLPVGRYSRMRASANLRNWLAFLTLRMASSAQWEIREYANTVAELVREKFPRTYELFASK